MNQVYLRQPIFFEGNRVYRVYLGGKGLAPFCGTPETDDFFPEEWIASAVKAINPRYFGVRDGVSVVQGTDIFFDDLLREYPEEMLGGKPFGCLVKFLDSAIRLPVQVHPTRAFSREHFHSSYGKAEAWLVLAARDENARIHFGFRDKITIDELKALEDRSETERDVMAGVLQSVPAKAGDIFFIRAGLVHAIGAGCTILEIQEPSDFTIQPENWCGDYHISDHEKYIGLTRDAALSCFDLSLCGEAAVAAARVIPRCAEERKGYRKEVLIDEKITPCFSLYRHVFENASFSLPTAPAVYVLLDGEAEIIGESYKRVVKKGEYFFLPKAASGMFRMKGCGTLAECCSE